MTTPTIFLSAASADLKEWRNLLHKALERAGCKVHTQEQSFAAPAGNVLALLRQHLDKSDFVIHLAGLAYGAEPEQPAFPDRPGFQCSYTQFEYYYAHQKGKKVIAFVCAAAFPYLPFTEKAVDDADRERRRLLQLAHRERVAKGRFDGTPLEGHPHRPLSESVANVGELMAALAGAIGTIRDHGPALTAAQQELTGLASLHQLPPVPPGFVGRGADLEVLRARRSSGAAQITGLKGMGGIGKTALAVVLANEWSADFPDAQIVLDGRGTRADAPGAAALLGEVLHAFYPTAKLPEGEKELRDLYLQTLAGKRVLVLLDNARDAAQAKPLLPPAGCALLVTSRHSFMLGSIAPHRVGELPESESVELLRTLCPVLSEADAVAVARRCARLPLALRLAGSHLALDATDRGGAPDVAHYLARLNSGRLRALDADAPDAGEVTVSETLRLSEEALPEELRDAWRKTGVFPASFDAAAGLAVAGATDEMLRQLLRRSLIDADGPRYRLHDLAAEYARDCLTPQALDAGRRAHAEYYRGVLAACDDLYLSGGSGVSKGLTLFDAERAHVEGAHAWLLAAPQNDPHGQERDALLVSYPDAGVYVLNLRHHARERIKWLEAALAAARRLKDRRAEGNALGNLGLAWATLGDARKAIGYYEQHLAIAREIGDRRGEGNALGNLGLAWAALGDARKAVGYYEQRLAVAHEIGDRRGEANALFNSATSLDKLDERSEAQTRAAQAAEIFAAIESPHAETARQLADRLRSA